MFRPLRTRSGVVRFFVINARAQISCELDEEHEVKMRLQGKKKKYWQVQLLKNGTIQWFYLHRIMAFSWLGDSPHVLRTIVDHQDGDSLNNCVNNLRWVTSTGNNINKRCFGIIEEGGVYYPRIAGYTHTRFGSTDLDLVTTTRKILVESYVRFTCRCPEKGNNFPHKLIYNF